MQNAQLLLNPLLHLAIILPLLLIFMKERTRENYLRVLSIVVCYCVSDCTFANVLLGIVQLALIPKLVVMTSSCQQT